MAERFEEGTVTDVIGRGLVREGRARRDQIRKRQQRYQNRVAAANVLVPLGVGLVKDNLMQKAQDFFESEAAMNTGREQRKASKIGAALTAERGAIAASGKDTYTYNYDIIEPLLMEEFMSAAEALEQEQNINILGRNIETGQPMNQQFIGTVKKAAAELAQQRTDTFNQAEAALDSVVSNEEFDAMRGRRLRDVTPTTIPELVGRTVNRFFGGRSTPELQAQAINDIRSHHFNENAKALNAFETALEEGKNINNAFDYAELVKEIDEYVPREVRQTYGSQIVNRPDNSVVQVVTITPVMEDGKLGPPRLATEREGGGVRPLAGLGAELSPAEQRARLATARSGFDVTRDGTTMVGSQVFMEDFVANLNLKKADGETDLLPSNASNLSEYTQVLDAWNTWIADNTDKIIDPDVKAMQREWLLLGRTLASESPLILQLEKDLQDVKTPHGTGLESVIGRNDFQEVVRYIETMNLDPNSMYGDPLEKPAALDIYRDLAQKLFDYKATMNGFLNINTQRYEILGR